AVVLAPHTDDETLGCGGTIAKLVERGYDVYVYAFATGTANPYEFNKSVTCLGGKPKVFSAFVTRYFHTNRQEILDKLIEIRKQLEPSKVFVPALSDCHQDHQVITQEAIRAFKHSSIYGFELPWNSFDFKNTCYNVLSPEHINIKMQALMEYS